MLFRQYRGAAIPLRNVRFGSLPSFRMIGRYCGRAGANADPDHFGRQATPSIWKVSLSRKATLSRGSFAMLLAEDFPRAQPRLRLASNPVGSERMGLERPHPFKRPVWPFGFDGPSVAVSENDMEYRLCGLGRHGLGPKGIADRTVRRRD